MKVAGLKLKTLSIQLRLGDDSSSGGEGREKDEWVAENEMEDVAPAFDF